MDLKKITVKKEESYSAGYDSKLIQTFQKRTVMKEANFFIPHINSKMNLLDCGCGPGNISIGFSQIISEGHITAIDIEPSQIEMAKNNAQNQGITNISFQVGNIYKLPFKDNSFDAIFVHAVFQHISKHLEALKELHRVLKPGGVIGLRDDDQGGLILSPYSPEMEKVIILLKNYMKYHGGDPCVGRRHRELLHKSGFINVKVSASCEYDNSLEETTRRGDLAARLIENMTPTAIQLGWADKDEMKALSKASKDWGRNLDAFDAIIWCEAVGYKSK